MIIILRTFLGAEGTTLFQNEVQNIFPKPACPSPRIRAVFVWSAFGVDVNVFGSDHVFAFCETVQKRGTLHLKMTS